ncbi:hypothetical protein G6F57_008182 [Rhizopus arrhizus]|uniref:25S rRNA (Uridine(2843)-N(3))-methyltransferase n=1 Tax=Rhizopus oryzae TaxID=64495 RepID=A0A9P7BQQ0_RHIOR|nr:hypothetical protein G6F23_007766 [Rhizopus arrhizus]KAG0756779.1 hypothetical protein G6F24_010927 [Rhizopus arrhizus]KAG0782882.1 hypothetical protein G6F21_010858 [Rhizopus arrhizus]KAG0809489.1 hypothetical protein G6F20_008730 [Rhizopus arrhizus]KAG0827249.1 hypothetical protein G6F19_008880 [Rhizopus arrhizus]
MDSTNLSDSIKNLKIKEDKPKATYDKAALKERWKILGNDAEQNIVSMIRKACMNTFARNDFMKTLQAIKASFVHRDYEGIFTESSNLEVYAAAYVPGRALCYYEIFSSRPSLLKILMKRSQLYCIGSGSGSELVAIAAAMTRVPAERQKIKLVMQDIGEYESVLTSFEETIRERWSVTEDQLSCVYEKGDILDPDSTLIKERMSQADLITFMFVINELFVKKAAALNLIQTLVKSMKSGAHLLVVESAGSFSHLKVGNKTYMVYMLLDAIQDLELVISEDSRWYRHPDNLKYPIDVQNMRYFIRLYKKK